MARKIYRPPVIGTRTIVVTFSSFRSGEMVSRGWKRHGDDLRKVKNACEKSYVSFWIFRWHKKRSLFSSLSMQSFLFHVFPEKKECGF